MKKVVFVITLVLNFQILTLNCFSAGPGTTAATFLKLGVGSRPVAMGEAYSAVADDLNALYWNPAGLSLAKGKQIGFVHTEWMQSIRYEYIAYSQPAFGGTIGAGITYLYITDIERRGYSDPTGATIEGLVPANDLSVAVSYAKTVSDKLNLGGTVKIINQVLDDKSALGAAVDLGLQYKPSKEGIILGFALQNIGHEAPFITTANPLPLNLKAGVANKTADNKLTLAADLNYGIMDTIWSVGAGVEYWLVPMFSIRGGYKYNSAINLTLGPLSGLTCGAGFKINIMDIDYAFVPYGDLGYTHRISLLVKF